MMWVGMVIIYISQMYHAWFYQLGRKAQYERLHAHLSLMHLHLFSRLDVETLTDD